MTMIRKFTFLLLLLAVAPAIFAQVSDSFLKNASKKVWSTEIPEFNAQTPIPDSLSENNSAVIIAEYHDIDASHSQFSNMTLRNTTTCRYTRRFMVKLLDQAAIERYSEFEFGDKGAGKAGAYEYYTRKNAFGARIHKNGEVKEVDLSDAFKITEGKKGDKEIGRKIAIPGLEVGDILEYFYYREDIADVVSVDALNIAVLNHYPVMNFMINGAFDKSLTVEYRTSNGCPEPEEQTSGSRNCISLKLTDLPAAPSDRFTREMRQLPLFRVAMLNNTPDLPIIPASARKSGMYANLPMATYFTDMRSLLALGDYSNSVVKNHAKKVYRTYAKNNPQATRRQLIDAAFLAMQYAYITQKGDNVQVLSNLQKSAIFNKMLEELKLSNGDCGVAAVTSKGAPFIEDILSHTDPSYGLIAGDSLYLFSTLARLAPGEVPASIQGEKSVLFKGDYKDTNFNLQLMEIAANSDRDNAYTSMMNVTVDTDKELLRVHRDNKATGAMKEAVNLLIEGGDLFKGFEAYLGIPEKDRYDYVLEDMEEWDKTLMDAMKDETKRSVGLEPSEVSNIKVDNYGYFPDDTECRYSLDCTFEGLVEDMGDDLLIHIGKLFGDTPKIEGRDRDRSIPAFLPSTYFSRQEVMLDIPEGYEVNEESLAAIKDIETNALGQFYVNTATEDDGKVKISVLDRRKTFYVPMDIWPLCLQLHDKASNFADASIILSKKK